MAPRHTLSTLTAALSPPGGEEKSDPGSYRVGLVCAAVVGLVSLVFYVLTLPPGLTWAYDSADGGELAAAAATLGIPHPPGYPTYVLLAHLFTHLPLGELATRTNLFSAVGASGAAFLLTGATMRLTRNPFAAVGAGLTLGLAPLLWSQAIVTEVHALNTLFAAGLLALAIHVEAAAARIDRPRRLSLIAGAIWGLSLGNHLTALFFAPIVLLTAWRLRRFGAWIGLGAALGLLVYVYLPLRARADPAINWGDPQTWRRFWWMISGGPYRSYPFALPSAYIVQRVRICLGLLIEQVNWVGAPIAVIGLLTLQSTRAGLFTSTTTMTTLCAAFAIGYDTVDSYLYLTPTLACLGLWLGTGLDWTIRALHRRPRLAWSAAALALIAPVAAGVLRVPTMDLSADRSAALFERKVLTAAPPDAVLLSQEDRTTFALWYFRHGLGRREDVLVIDLDLLGYAWYKTRIAEQTTGLRSLETLYAEETPELEKAARQLERPVCQITSPEAGLSCAGVTDTP